MASTKTTLLMVNDYPDYIDSKIWSRELSKRVPELQFRLWPHRGNPADVDIVLIDKGAPPGLFEGMTRLRALVFLGAGIDGLRLSELPAGVGVVRLATRELASEVVQYLLLRVLCRQRHAAEYAAQQQRREWRPIAPMKTPETSIVVLGAGRIGGWAAKLFAELGYRTAVWSRSPKQIDTVESFSGPSGFKAALAERDYVICTLPLTSETHGVLNADAFAAMKREAFVISVGRGAHLDERALIRAIDDGHLSGACLDVFAVEPLPASSPLWTHPRVTITPHVASYWIDSGIEQAAQVCRQVRSGVEITNLVDLNRGY
jgi:glyoxylate/hydroxypyruvate reductase A